MAWTILDGSSGNISNDSSVPGGSISDALDFLLGEITTLQERMHFVAGSIEDVTIGTDPNNPSFLTDMFLAAGGFGVTIDTPTGAVKNVTGRTIAQAVGTISFQPDKAGGGTTLLHLWSERSMDNGVTWIQNSNSLRAIEISNNGETFKTSLSAVLDWENDSLLRFRVYALSGGAVTFSSPTDTVLGGEVIDGYSIAWELGEN